jgi:hypothetical protein
MQKPAEKISRLFFVRLLPGGGSNSENSYFCRMTIVRQIFLCIFCILGTIRLHSQTPSNDREGIVVMERMKESAEFDVRYATVPHKKLTPASPLSTLPVRKITDKYVITDRIDSVRIGYLYDSVSSPQVFTYKPAYTEYGQAVVIKRQNDWLILDWTHFKIAGLAALKMSWIDVDGKGSLELMFSLVSDQNVEQILGMADSPFTGMTYNTHSHWKKAKGFCILDIDNLTFVVDNIYTGYEYYYELSTYVRGEKNEGVGYVYPNAYDTDRERKTMSVWYDFKIKEGKNMITVRRTGCRETVISDASKRYINDKSKTEPSQEKVEYSKDKCTPMYTEGVYVFRDGRFTLK